MTRAIFGPTFEDMLHPAAIDPLMRLQAVSSRRRLSVQLLNIVKELINQGGEPLSGSTPVTFQSLAMEDVHEGRII